jgi:5-methylcytosine-specific restriction enzyme subunit McrC
MSYEINIVENQTISLNEELYNKLYDAKSSDSSLPFSLIDNTLIFDEYVIGSIQVGDITLNIQPRNKAFNLNNVFEMIVYTDFSFLKEDEISGFGFSAGFGVDVLIKQFVENVRSLCNFGLTGNYIQKYVRDSTVYGALNFSNYHKKIISFQGIESLKTEYSLNIAQNSLIKKALKKCLHHIKQPKLRAEIVFLLNNFLEIDDYYGFTPQDFVKIKNFYSPNKFYPICLETALKILENVKVSYLNSNLVFKSFLFNSNDIFEKYVRAILKRNLEINISKLDTNTVQITSINSFYHSPHESLTKYVSPDILIGYESKDSKALAIIDVKNKVFNPSRQGNYTDLISSSDLYQIIIYSLKFKTDIAALVYPSDHEIRPISFFADIQTTLHIFLLSINMQDTLANRHKNFLLAVRDNILKAL